MFLVVHLKNYILKNAIKSWLWLLLLSALFATSTFQGSLVFISFLGMCAEFHYTIITKCKLISILSPVSYIKYGAHTSRFSVQADLYECLLTLHITGNGPLFIRRVLHWGTFSDSWLFTWQATSHKWTRVWLTPLFTAASVGLTPGSEMSECEENSYIDRQWQFALQKYYIIPVWWLKNVFVYKFN